MLSTMSNRFKIILFSLVVWAGPIATQGVNITNITIPLNNSITYDNREIYGGFITLVGLTNVQVDFSDVNKNLTFLVFQAHSHMYNISVYTKAEAIKQVTGTNVGLVTYTELLDTFHIVNSNENMTVRVYISVHGYTKDDPIPGGCNLEFSIPISPFLRVQTQSDHIYVDAAAPSVDAGCKQTNTADMTFYMVYLPEMNFYADIYFHAIRNMMSLKNILKYGVVIPPSSWPITRRMLSAYPGTGAVYAVVASRDMNKTDSNPYSVYIPSHSYGCESVLEDGCEVIVDLFSQFLCAVLLFVGIFICFFGHRFFNTGMFFAGFFSGVIITYILIALITVIDKPALLAAAALSGVFFGCIWWLFWWLYGIPVMAVLLPSLNLGFLLAAIFYYTLPSHFLYLEVDINFWSIFALLMMLVALSLVSVSFAANILCCAILGAYASVLSIDYYLGSSLKFIIVNTIRRAVVPHFNKALLMPPFQWRDFWLTMTWILMAILGFLFQHWHNRGRPPFPPPPRAVRPSMSGPIIYGTITAFTRPERDSTTPTNQRAYNERTALLS